MNTFHYSENLVMIFDTETTGLLPRIKNGNWNDLDLTDFPFITQMSYLIYDLDKFEVISSYNQYIRIPDHVIISPKVIEITGITREICNTKGIDIQDALVDIFNDYMKCRKIIAHNFTFDRDMITLEILRHQENLIEFYPDIIRMFDRDFMSLHHKYYDCTMKIGTSICKIQKPSVVFPNHSLSFKWPKLSELHFHLFQTIPENLHNALIDVFVCLRCYLKIKYNYTIPTCYFYKMIYNTIKLHNSMFIEERIEPISEFNSISNTTLLICNE